MNRAFSLPRILTVAALSACGLLLCAARPAHAVNVGQGTAGDLFANYYAAPIGYPGAGAKLYVSPRPTPPVVGHTYITYQPLMPHEFLYPHHRVYVTKHDDAPRTRTSVHWRGNGSGLTKYWPTRYVLTPGL
ncbi:MAG: hypothetical protein ABFC63_03605 [Thermoguttaceae bacterium]